MLYKRPFPIYNSWLKNLKLRQKALSLYLYMKTEYVSWTIDTNPTNSGFRNGQFRVFLSNADAKAKYRSRWWQAGRFLTELE